MTHNQKSAMVDNRLLSGECSDEVMLPLNRLSGETSAELATDFRSRLPAESGNSARPLEGGMDIARAIYFCQTQECLLHKCHGTLERMQALAAISRNSSDLYREGYASDFYTAVSELARIAAKENDGNRLFDGATQIVDIDREGSKLVMAGVNLDKKVFRNVLAANISTGTTTAQALLDIKSALQQIVLEQSIVTANLDRLRFLSKQLDSLKSSLLTEAPAGTFPMRQRDTRSAA